MQASNQIYLISDVDISVPDLIRNIANLLGRKAIMFPFPVVLLKYISSIIGKKEMTDRLTQSLLIDSSKLVDDLDWSAPYSFNEGLKRTINWYVSVYR